MWHNCEGVVLSLHQRIERPHLAHITTTQSLCTPRTHTRSSLSKICPASLRIVVSLVHPIHVCCPIFHVFFSMSSSCQPCLQHQSQTTNLHLFPTHARPKRAHTIAHAQPRRMDVHTVIAHTSDAYTRLILSQSCHTYSPAHTRTRPHSTRTRPRSTHTYSPAQHTHVLARTHTLTLATYSFSNPREHAQTHTGHLRTTGHTRAHGMLASLTPQAPHPKLLLPSSPRQSNPNTLRSPQCYRSCCRCGCVRGRE